jgi:hypothetical protein
MQAPAFKRGNQARHDAGPSQGAMIRFSNGENEERISTPDPFLGGFSPG